MKTYTIDIPKLFATDHSERDLPTGRRVKPYLAQFGMNAPYQSYASGFPTPLIIPTALARVGILVTSWRCKHRPVGPRYVSFD